MNLSENNFKGQFCLSGACYPETHQEADGFKKDLEALKKKVDAGAEYLVTQIFFDNDYYYRLVREARKIGITVPIHCRDHANYECEISDPYNKDVWMYDPISVIYNDRGTL